MVEITPNYVNKFKCLGSECIDTCCQGWMISIDKKTHNKYQGIEIDGVNKINKFLKIWDKPTERHYSAIKMDKSGYCPFLGKDKLCGLQKKYGESYLSETCNRFPRREIDFASNKFTTLKLACPEAARLCLSFKDSMNIVEDKHYNRKSIDVVPIKYKNNINKAGELILNKFYRLLKNEDINYINSLIILQKLLDEQMNISLNLDKFEDIYNFYYQEFHKIEITTFDNSYIKLSLLKDLLSFVDCKKNLLEKNNFKNQKFFDLIRFSYEELIGRFSNFDNAVENFNFLNNEYVLKFDNKNKHILRNFFLNEILGYSGIFTSPTTSSRNKLYITLLEVSLSKIFIAAKCSKKKKMPILDDYIDIIYNVDKSFGMFIHADNNSELYFNKSIEEYIKKVDSNSIFNSLIFLCA